MRAVAVDTTGHVAVVAEDAETGGEAIGDDPTVDILPDLGSVDVAAAIDVVDGEELRGRLATAGAVGAVVGEDGLAITRAACSCCAVEAWSADARALWFPGFVVSPTVDGVGCCLETFAAEGKESGATRRGFGCRLSRRRCEPRSSGPVVEEVRLARHPRKRLARGGAGVVENAHA